MKLPKDFLRALVLLMSVVSVVPLIYFGISDILGQDLFDHYSISSKYTTLLMGTLFGALISTYLAFFIRTLNKNPTPLKTAIIGLPRSGKTVYLSILFNELQLYKSSKILFQAYGIDTIEEVEKNIRTLQRGKWLKPTSRESVFYFRANAILRGNLFEKKYTVEIGDYAGEKNKEFDSSSEDWLHKTDYFKYVVSSDIIFLAVDGEIIANNDSFKMQECQSALVAAMQVLLDEKGIKIGAKLTVPVSLLILKSDLFTEDCSELIDSNFSRIFSLCRNRCEHFNIVEVSSVGSVDDNNNPTTSLQPSNVVDPMIWALKRINI